jgi:hypothetical protein
MYVASGDGSPPPEGPHGPVVFGIPPLPDERAGPGTPGVAAGAGTDEPTPDDGAEAEPAPAPARRSAAERAREIFSRKDEPKKRGRRTGRARISLETLAGAGWSGLTAIITRLGGPQFAPVAAIMAFEEPVAGMILDETIEGTPVDRPAQAIARLMESGTDAALLIGPPVVVGGVCAGLIPYPVGRAMLAQMLKSWVVMAGPKLRQVAEREQTFAAEMAQMAMPGPDGEPVPATLDDIIETIFAAGPPPEDGEAAEHAAAANGQHAPAG